MRKPKPSAQISVETVRVSGAGRLIAAISVVVFGLGLGVWRHIKEVQDREPPVCKSITLEYPSRTAKVITWIDGQWGYSTTDSTLVARSAYACKPLTSGEKPPIIWDENLP